MNLNLTRREIGRILACIQKAIVWYEMEINSVRRAPDVNHPRAVIIPEYRKQVTSWRREIEALKRIDAQLRQRLEDQTRRPATPPEPTPATATHGSGQTEPSTNAAGSVDAASA